MRIVTIAMSIPAAALSPASADVGSDLRQFWERAGGGVNVTKPSVYQGQRAGYASLGSLYLRTRPRNSQLAGIQLPSVRAGCGGIDIFGGAFSFISKEEMIALLEAIMQNASGFAFELALQSLSPGTQEIVGKLRDLMAQINSMNMSSCEAGQLLASNLWPEMEGASQHICRTIGAYTGVFADAAATRHGCGTGGQYTSTINRAKGELKDQVPVNVNYAWRAIRKNNFLSSHPNIAEFFMTLTGTVITKGGKNDNAPFKHRTIPPRALSPEAAKALVEGGEYPTLACDESTNCLNPTVTNGRIKREHALYAVTARVIRNLSDAIDDDNEPPKEAFALISLTSIPVLTTLTTAKSYKYRFTDDDISSMAELVAIDLAMSYIDEALGELINSAANVDITGTINQDFQKTVQQSRGVLQQLRIIAQQRYAAALQSLERLQLARGELGATSGSIFTGSVNQGER